MKILASFINENQLITKFYLFKENMNYHRGGRTTRQS